MWHYFGTRSPLRVVRGVGMHLEAFETERKLLRWDARDIYGALKVFWGVLPSSSLSMGLLVSLEGVCVREEL